MGSGAFGLVWPTAITQSDLPPKKLVNDDDAIPPTLLNMVKMNRKSHQKNAHLSLTDSGLKIIELETLIEISATTLSKAENASNFALEVTTI